MSIWNFLLRRDDKETSNAYSKQPTTKANYVKRIQFLLSKKYYYSHHMWTFQNNTMDIMQNAAHSIWKTTATTVF